MGCCAVRTQRIPLNIQGSLHTALGDGTASLPVRKPQGWSPPDCPVAFVYALLSAPPVHQPEWAHSGAFMRLGDPGRLDTIRWEGVLRALHMRMCLFGLPPDVSDCSIEPRGVTLDSLLGLVHSVQLGALGGMGGYTFQGGRNVQAWACSSLSLTLTFSCHLCVPPTWSPA